LVNGAFAALLGGALCDIGLGRLASAL
jgi:hypothetical protein